MLQILCYNILMDKTGLDQNFITPITKKLTDVNGDEIKEGMVLRVIEPEMTYSKVGDEATVIKLDHEDHGEIWAAQGSGITTFLGEERVKRREIIKNEK